MPFQAVIKSSKAAEHYNYRENMVSLTVFFLFVLFF